MSGNDPERPPETAEERELATIAMEQYQSYQQTFVPLENYLIQQVQDVGGQERQAQALSAAGFEQAFARAEPGVAQGLSRRGAAPGSGAFAGGLGEFANAKGLSRSMGAVDVGNATQDQFAGNLQGLINLGQGQASESLGSYANVADAAGRQAIMDSQANFAARQAVGAGIGTGVGMMYGSYNGGATGSGYQTGRRPAGLQNG